MQAKTADLLRENVNLPLYEQQLRETDLGIQNLLRAIQQGIPAKSTKGRLEEPETKSACFGRRPVRPKGMTDRRSFTLAEGAFSACQGARQDGLPDGNMIY